MVPVRTQYDMLPRTASPTPSELEDNDETPFGFRTLMHTRGKKQSRKLLFTLAV